MLLSSVLKPNELRSRKFEKKKKMEKAFSTIEDDLDVKKGSAQTRYETYGRLCSLLSTHWRGDDETFQRHSELVLETLRFSLRKGVAEEKFNALKLLALMLLTAKVPFQTFQSTLEHLVRDPPDELTRDAAADCLALGLWLASLESVPGFNAVIDGALEALKKVRNNSVCGRAFALLASTKSADELYDYFPSAAWLVDRFVNAKDVAGQVELGWGICVLYCGLREHQESEGSEYDPTDVDEYVAAEAFCELLHENKGLKVVAQMYEEGALPTESLTFNTQKFTFDSFRKIAQIHFLRGLLGVAFSAQMSNNAVLYDAFGFSVAADPAKEKLSNIEKRIGRSPNSAQAKATTKDKRRDRQNKVHQRQYDQGYDPE